MIFTSLTGEHAAVIDDTDDTDDMMLTVLCC